MLKGRLCQKSVVSSMSTRAPQPPLSSAVCELWQQHISVIAGGYCGNQEMESQPRATSLRYHGTNRQTDRQTQSGTQSDRRADTVRQTVKKIIREIVWQTGSQTVIQSDGPYSRARAPSSCACPLSCSLLTFRAVSGLSEPIRGGHAVGEPCAALDSMTSDFWCYVSKNI